MHNNTSAGTVLQAIKGGKDGRPAVEQLVAIRRRSLTSKDSRTGVQRTKTVQWTTQRRLSRPPPSFYIRDSAPPGR